MNRQIINKSNFTIYFDAGTNTVLENIWDHINIDSLSKSDFNNHFYNSLHYIQGPNQYRPVLQSIYPIPPRSRWMFNGKEFTCTQSLAFSDANYSLFHLIERLSRPIKKYKIGVELSGGLDSSIIISMLLENGIEPFLIGFTCDRYEFRTERYIQELYSKKVKKTILLNSKEILPFENLLSCYAHQLPNPTSLYYYSKSVIASYCRENHVDILFNGMSGDALCCESVNGNYLPSVWHNWMMDNRWFHENVFTKSQVQYLPVYTKSLASKIFKERLNMGFDSQKLWAREYFKNYLPLELVNYTYKADHVGDLIEGIKKSYFEVSELFKITVEVTNNREFSESSLSKLYSNIEKYHDSQLKEIMAKVSYALWIYSCVKNLDL
jgi:hypothetical protein